MLDADIMNVLRTARAKNPDVRICGIEETEEQQKKQRRHSGSRDTSIAHNFWNRYQAGRRHVILFGALHCTNDPNWLFGHLYGQAPLPLKNRMVNARVLEEHQNGPVEAFVFFLDELGIEKTPEDLVSAWAGLARASGLDGVVASAREAAALRRDFGTDFLIVTPGIRPLTTVTDDQRRVVTPADAVRAGADVLVVGRPITRAEDPAAAAREIVGEMAS